MRIVGVNNKNKKPFKLFYLFFLIHISCVFVAKAQQKLPVNVRKYSQTEGLASYNVRKIVFDKYGFAWVATQEGLSRFDSKSFINLPFSRNLRSGSDIRDLAFDSIENCIWALDGERSLFKIDAQTGNVLKEYYIPKKSDDDWNICLVLSNNYLWIGCLSGVKLFSVVSGKFIEEPFKDFPVGSISQNDEIRSMALDGRGNLWIFTSTFKILIVDPNGHQLIKVVHFDRDKSPNSQKRCRVWGACYSNGMYAATDVGVIKFEFKNYDNILQNKPDNAKISGRPCYSISIYRPNEFLIAGDGLFLINNDLNVVNEIQNENPETRDWLKKTRTMTITEPYPGIVALGCTQGFMLFSQLPSPFVAVNSIPSSDRPIDHVYSMLKKDSIVYINADDQIYMLTSKGIQIIAREKKFRDLFYGLDEQVWVSTDEGIGLISKQKFSYLNYPFSKTKFNSSIQLRTTLLLGTDDYSGLIQWNLKNNHILHIDVNSTPKIFSNVVKKVYKDYHEGIWVLSDNVISYKKGENSYYKKISYSNNKLREYWMYFDICEAGGYYWIAVHHYGIIKVDQKLNMVAAYTTQNGLSDNGVYKIFPLGDTGLVITTNNGLSVFNIKTETFKNYYQSDGLHGNGFEESCGTTKNNIIYAGGVKGFTIIDPSMFTKNTTPPKVYINRVHVDRSNKAIDIDTTNMLLHDLEVPNDVLQISIYFSGIDYGNPERTTFAYRIKEHNPDWVNLGNQNHINLIGLAPGKYHLEVKAANEDNMWSQPAELTLFYLPKWYQSMWFKGLLVLVCMGIGYIIYRIRIGQILKQQQIRKDVASDLHDDIGSSLNSVKVFAHLAKAEPESKDYIRSLEENLEHATTGLRDMIWVLDDKLDTVADLCNRLDQLSAKTARAAGIDVQFFVTDSAKHEKLTKPLKRNLFLIAKEAINNSLKYAGCRKIKIIFGMKSQKLSMTISDDGRGFDVFTTHPGYGLTNIKTRANQISFNLTLRSDNLGTEITVSEK